jgi:hypothetical protein
VKGVNHVTHKYRHTPFIALRTAVPLSILALFFFVPMALLSFNVVSPMVGAVSVICFVFAFTCLVVAIIPARKTEIVFLLSFGYAAIIVGLFGNWAMSK